MTSPSDLDAPVRGQQYGTQYSCGGCDATGGGSYQPREEATHWWMGLDSTGQAHYVCTNCRPSFFHITPLYDDDYGTGSELDPSLDREVLISALQAFSRDRRRLKAKRERAATLLGVVRSTKDEAVARVATRLGKDVALAALLSISTDRRRAQPIRVRATALHATISMTQAAPAP